MTAGESASIQGYDLKALMATCASNNCALLNTFFLSLLPKIQSKQLSQPHHESISKNAFVQTCFVYKSHEIYKKIKHIFIKAIDKKKKLKEDWKGSRDLDYWAIIVSQFCFLREKINFLLLELEKIAVQLLCPIWRSQKDLNFIKTIGLLTLREDRMREARLRFRKGETERGSPLFDAILHKRW